MKTIPAAAPADRLLNMREVCQILGGLSRPSVYVLFARADLTPVKVGGRTMVSAREMDRYLVRIHEEATARRESVSGAAPPSRDRR